VKGLAITGLGVLFLIAPASYRFPRAVLWTLLVAFGAPILAFLPASWTGTDIAWRDNLIENWDIPLKSLSTSLPWLTAEAWVDYAIGLCWLTWCATRGSTTDDRRTIMRILAVGIGLLAILTIFDYHKWIHISWWRFGDDPTNSFGPFANRNHTSSLMAIGSVLCAAAAYDSYRRKEHISFLFLALMVPFGIVLLSNTSRAGLALCFVGLTLWLWTASLRKGFIKKAALIGSLTLGGVSLLFLFGGKLLTRLTASAGSASPLSAIRFRSRLYQDAVAITSDAPWTGIGMGTFQDVYPQLASFHEPSCRFLHPESDWFWLMTEGGIVTFIAFLLLSGMLALMTGPWRAASNNDTASRQDRRIRNSLGIVALLAALHGLVDVPNHTPGYGLLTALALGLSLESKRLTDSATRMSKLIARFIAVGVLAFGVIQISTSLGNPVFPGISSAKILLQEATRLSQSEQDKEALEKLNPAASMRPLDWSIYFQRAQIHLRMSHPHSQAHLDFGRARALEPSYAWFCFVEGQIWLEWNPTFTIPAWREALRRNPGEEAYWFQMMMDLGAGYPNLIQGLGEIARTPALKLIFLSKVALYEKHSPDAFRAMLDRLRWENPGIESMDSVSRNFIFQVWHQRGDRGALVKELEANAAWRQDGWQILCNEYARDGKYEEAFKMAKRYELPPTSPSITGLMPVNQLEQNFLFNPTDARRGIDLYFGYKSRGEWTQALATLEKVAALPTAPNYLSYEMASIYAEKEDFRRAWELMLQYLSRPK
jgi:O-antigen ligase